MVPWISVAPVIAAPVTTEPKLAATVADALQLGLQIPNPWVEQQLGIPETAGNLPLELEQPTVIQKRVAKPPRDSIKPQLHGLRPIGTIAYMGGLPSVLEDFAFSLAQMVGFSQRELCRPGEYIKILRTRHSFHTLARNQLVAEFEGDWLLQLDTDHSFEPDLLLRLLHTMKKYDSPSYPVDVVAGLYLHKHPPYNPTLWHWCDEKTFKPAYLTDWPEGEVLEVGVAGTGCLLVKRRVFETIHRELKQEPFSTQEFPGLVGEDFAFARRCRQLGYKIICDPRIECYHLKGEPLSVATHYPKEKRCPLN